LRNLNFSRERTIQGHRLHQWFLAGIAILCTARAALALDPLRTMSQYVHDRWGQDRGFIGGAVYAIGQSDDGYLWIGTERGLVRFDGFRFTPMPQPLPDAPPTGPVRGLLSDSDGNLWIRLEGARMLLYHDGKFEDAYARFNLQDVIVTAMAPDGEGGVLFSALGDRTMRYHNGRIGVAADTDMDTGTVIALARTRDRRVWLGTRDDGLYLASGGHIVKSGEVTGDAKINALLPDYGGGLWIGTDNGLELWDGIRLTKLELLSAVSRLQILTLADDHDGNVWIGTNHGIERYTRNGGDSLEPLDSASADDVTAIFEDRDGDLWFGGSQGIERLRNGMFMTYSTAQGLPPESSGPIYVDADGRTWFAPLSGGLWWLKDGKAEPVAIAGIDHDLVYSIDGGGGEVWLGRQRGGLTVLTGSGDSLSARTYTQADGLAQDSVYTVHRSRDGTVWAGTISGGVSRLAGGAFTNFTEADGLPSNTAHSIAEGDDGAVWLATPGGLACFSNGRWTKRTLLEGLPSLNVRTVFEDSKHVLWIATSGGLAFLRSGRIETPERLPEVLREQILGITEDGMGSLWFVTSDHVLEVNRDRLLEGTLDDDSILSYGIGDGLHGVEGVDRDRTLVTDRMGRVWISLNRGLSMTDPKIAAKDSVPVMARVESMSADGNPVSLGSAPKLASGVQSIVFDYGASNLAQPERVRFRYKLDGSDKGWSDAVASRQVVYRNLGPGAYRFHLVASSGDWLWNGSETTVGFVIEPAFWQTWWFRILCLTVFVGAVLGAYRLRMFQLTHQLNIRFQERLAERMRIAQDLHDTLLQGVLSASLQLDVAEDQLPEDSPTKPMLKRTLQLMRSVTEEGRNAVRGLRAQDEAGRSLEMAFSRVRQEFSFDDKTGYRVVVNSNPRPLRPLIRDEVYRIGREAVVNAFRHAHANSVEVEVEYASRHLRVLVRDDGRGIDPQVLHAGRDGHWGLPGMRERSEGIGASLRLRSRVGAGTEVELTVPGSIAFESESRGAISHWFPWRKKERQGPNSTGTAKRVNQ
jgi:signal transduction histidine kinase/ligand-binding sensor domain-containing protein